MKNFNLKELEKIIEEGEGTDIEKCIVFLLGAILKELRDININIKKNEQNSKGKQKRKPTRGAGLRKQKIRRI